MFNKDLTIFSSYIEDGEDKYIKTLLPKSCFIDSTEIVNTNANGMEDANTILVLLPKSNCSKYLSPKQFKESENKEEHFTLQKGDKIVKGLVEKEYTSMVDLMKEQDNVYTITAVDDRDYGTVQHFEIAGK